MYSIKLTKKSKDFLNTISKGESKFILRTIYSLRENPFKSNLKKLKGYKLWRLKMKQYRAVLDILVSGKEIIVLTIGYRRNVYADFFKDFKKK